MSEKIGAAPTGRPDDSAARRTHWRGAAAPLNVWQQAIDAELVNAHLGIAHNDATFEGAQKAINELICWHIDVATNPATNGGQRLTDAKPIVLPELLEACKSLLTLTQLMANESYDDESIVEFEIFSEKTKSTRCLVLVFELAKARAAIAKATGAESSDAQAEKGEQP